MSVDMNGYGGMEPNPYKQPYTWLRWFMEAGALVCLLSAVFYVGYLQGVRYPATCILPMNDGSAMELKKINPHE